MSGAVDLLAIKLCGMGALVGASVSGATLDEGTLIPAGVVVGVLVTVAIAAWRLSAVLTRLQTRIDELERRIKRGEERE